MSFLLIVIILILVVIFLLILGLFFVIRLSKSKQLDNVIESQNASFDPFEKYTNDPRAVVISCYFNPQKSPYRRKVFNVFYNKIKHLNHQIIECVIGDAQPELPENTSIKRVYTKNLLWHKESLFNKIVSELPPQYEYVFWVDADVIFENNDWLTKGVEELQHCKIIQPFEYCAHLEKDQINFAGNIEAQANQVRARIMSGERVEKIRAWKSFCAVYCENPSQNIQNYDLHGHVGFAWGARREVLNKVPLYDKALIGGADHIIAHAAVGQIPHECITRAFAENISEIIQWSKEFYDVVKSDKNVGYVKGNLLHLWHGELAKRDYLNRIKGSNSKIKQINRKDTNGLYETDDDEFVYQYFRSREVIEDETDNNVYSSSAYNNLPSNYDHSNQSDYSSNTSENRDYFQSETVDFVGGGAGGSWDSSETVTTQASAGGEISNSFESGSTYS